MRYDVRQALVKMNRVLILGMVITIVAAPTLLLTRTATAAQITNRSVLISNPHASATVNYTFGLTEVTSSAVQSIKFLACTTPLGTCTAPAGINLYGGTVSQGGWSGATAFTKDHVTAGCTTNDVLCLTRTDATAEVGARTITDTGATNQDATNCGGAINCTFFIRITTFSGTAYSSQLDAGTVAGSTTQRFTVNAAIQEALTFCIGSTTVDDTITAPPACNAISGTSLDLGVLSTSDVSVSPVDAATNLGDGKNGVADLSTNASNGATVAYGAIQDTGSNHLGTLRVPGASCNAGTVNTDPCINAVGSTGATIAPLVENFGMTIAGVNCVNTVAYACSFTGGTYHLIRNANYHGNGSNTYTTDTDQVAGTTNSVYAWDESGTYQTIASSTSVVDGESLILKFAATPNAITPTGSYQVSADFVATPTY